MEESDWDELWSRVDETTYYNFTIEECEDDDEWNDISSIDTNGWDIDYWVTFIKEGKDFNYIVSGNLYYGNINIRKEKF